MSSDDIDHIPSIVPTREGGAQRSAPRAGNERRRAPARPERDSAPGKSAGVLVYLLAGIALVGAGLAFAWAWNLQGQLDQAAVQMSDYAARIGDLEARLSDTDEGMNQNAQVQAVKIAELESEVRKLWDNVWKQARERLAKLEADSAAQGKKVKGMESSLAAARAGLKEANADLAELKSIGGDMARLMSSAKMSQAEVERVADSLNRIDLALNKLERRVASNEDWVESVNAFRRQVNTSLSELRAQVQASRAAP